MYSSLGKTYAEGRMRLDARVAARLPGGEHMTFEGFPGLRLQASTSRKSWTYRYKSPVDDRMRQVKLGEWPAMAFAAAIAAWEKTAPNAIQVRNSPPYVESTKEPLPVHHRPITPSDSSAATIWKGTWR